MDDIQPTDALYLVPLDQQTLVDLATTDISGLPGAVVHVDDEGRFAVMSGDVTVFETIEMVSRGTLVRAAMILGDVEEMTSMLHDAEGAAALIDMEKRAIRGHNLLREAGGMAACRSKGRWRPIDAEHREIWGRHLVTANIAAMRAKAANDRRRHEEDRLAAASLKAAMAA